MDVEKIINSYLDDTIADVYLLIIQHFYFFYLLKKKVFGNTA